ncbi:MAG: M48 family metallopeptidase [Aridibacter sp.]
MPFHKVNYGKKIIDFKLQHSDRKTLAISVLPDLSVIVTAPNETSDIEKIKSKIKKRAKWILKQQSDFEKYQPTQPPRRFVSGETHLYLGRQYRLKVLEGEAESVKLKSGYFFVTTEDKKDRKRVESLLKDWYHTRAKKYFEKKIKLSMERFKRFGLQTPPVHLRNMTKRWGTYSSNGTINLNPDLIKTPSSCVEYVVIHELCHLIEPNHSRDFYRLLQRIMPEWEKRKSRLENTY